MMIQAIETVYNGYRFRSRLEARWAVFFDMLGIEYRYEPEGYDLGEMGYYLPDFYLPEQQCWIEIKGQGPTGEEQSKGVLLAEGTQSPLFIFYGEIRPYEHFHDESGKKIVRVRGNAYAFIPKRLCPVFNEKTVYEGKEYQLAVPHGDLFGWSECPHCHTLVISFMGVTGMARMNREVSFVSTPNDCDCLDKGLQHTPREAKYSHRLMEAYMAARQARFEHGETPVTQRFTVR